MMTAIPTARDRTGPSPPWRPLAAIGAGFLAATAGALAWSGLYLLTHLAWVVMPAAIGWLVGWSIARVSRDPGYAAGGAGGFLALYGIVLGAFMLVDAQVLRHSHGHAVLAIAKVFAWMPSVLGPVGFIAAIAGVAMAIKLPLDGVEEEGL